MSLSNFAMASAAASAAAPTAPSLLFSFIQWHVRTEPQSALRSLANSVSVVVPLLLDFKLGIGFPFVVKTARPLK
jgi:hypothetical protein